LSDFVLTLIGCVPFLAPLRRAVSTNDLLKVSCYVDDSFYDLLACYWAS